MIEFRKNSGVSGYLQSFLPAIIVTTNTNTATSSASSNLIEAGLCRLNRLEWFLSILLKSWWFIDILLTRVTNFSGLSESILSSGRFVRTDLSVASLTLLPLSFDSMGATP